MVPTDVREARAPTATCPAATWRPRRRRARRPEGFSLLELLVVLILIGLLSAVVIVRLDGPYRAARMGDVVQRIALVDEQTRSHSQRFTRAAELVFDLDKNLIEVRAVPAQSLPQSQLALPGGVRMERVRTGQTIVETGQARIPVTPVGQTPSYAIWLVGADGSRQGLFIAGLTGQMTHLKAESDEQSLFQLLRSPGIDSH